MADGGVTPGTLHQSAYPDFFACPKWEYSQGMSGWQRRTEFDSGWIRQRKPWREDTSSVSLQFRMNTFDFSRWTRWVSANAYEWFSIYLDQFGSNRQRALYEVRFTSAISWEYDAHDIVSVSVNGELGALLNPQGITLPEVPCENPPVPGSPGPVYPPDFGPEEGYPTSPPELPVEPDIEFPDIGAPGVGFVEVQLRIRRSGYQSLFYKSEWPFDNPQTSEHYREIFFRGRQWDASTYRFWQEGSFGTQLQWITDSGNPQEFYLPLEDGPFTMQLSAAYNPSGGSSSRNGFFFEFPVICRIIDGSGNIYTISSLFRRTTVPISEPLWINAEWDTYDGELPYQNFQDQILP